MKSIFLMILSLMASYSSAESMIGAPSGRLPLEVVKKVRPQYPTGETNFSGRVEIDFVVQENGNTSDVTVAEDVDAAVRKACVDAVSQWKFQPYHDDGKLRKVKTHFTFHAPVDGD